MWDLAIIPCNVVAPHTGAWIETFPGIFLYIRNASLPIRERGLKLYLNTFYHLGFFVAPHTGAWIETVCKSALISAVKRRSPYGSVD